MRVYYDRDADINLIKGRKVAIVGYGSQGHAHALNLRDSGVDVVVGLRPDSASREAAEKEGLTVLDVPEAASRGDAVMILLPDEKQADVWQAEIADGIACVITSVDAPRRLAFTLRAPGSPDTYVDLRLRRIPGGTHVRLTHSGWEDFSLDEAERIKEGLEIGWRDAALPNLRRVAEGLGHRLG